MEIFKCYLVIFKAIVDTVLECAKMVGDFIQ